MSKNQNEERLAAIAYILDRVEGVPATSSTRAFVADLIGGLAEVATSSAGVLASMRTWSGRCGAS